MTERAYDIDSGVLHCPQCGEGLPGIVADKVADCADHLSFEALQEAYRFLFAEHTKLQKKFLDSIRGTLIEELEADLKEANQSRGRMGAERYILEKKIEELGSRARYWKTTAEEYEKALRSSVEAMKEGTRARGREGEN